MFDVRVVIPEGVPAVYHPMIEAVARVCPVHNTLGHGVTIRVRIHADLESRHQELELHDDFVPAPNQAEEAHGRLHAKIGHE
jgi:hypothetical protein